MFITFSVILIFGIIILVLVWIFNKIVSICGYSRGSSNPSFSEVHVNIRSLLQNDDNWIADRMEHPDNYNEQHVQCAPYDLLVSQPQDITVRDTYGSISNPELTGTCNSNIDPLSTRDTRSTVAVSERLSIHSIQ